MIKAYLITFAVVAPLGACSSAPKTVTRDESARELPRDSRPDGPREEASGGLRDALLVLRRVHFAYDSARLEAPVRRAIAEAAGPLQRHPDVQLYIDGHADRRGTEVYNRSLGERRAKAVGDALAAQGIDRKRLLVNSFGKDKPLVGGEGVIAHATNRRVDFRLVRGDVQLVLEEGVLFDDRGNLIEGRTAEGR